MWTDFLINVPAADHSEAAAGYGLSLAKMLGARATGVSFGIEPLLTGTYFGGVPGEFIVEMRADAERQAKSAADRFMKAAQGLGVEAEARALTSTFDSAFDAFGKLARLYDLTIVGQPNPDRPGAQREFLEAALFESGRAVLIVPYVQKKPAEFNRILVAWDGGRAATRAVSEALPVLARAKQVELFIVETGKADTGQIPGADLARHLARHKLKVEVRRVFAASASDIDETILNAVTEDGIDLVVMGGYGHSRLRQFVLGGVTRSIIESMTAPVLMAH